MKAYIVAFFVVTCVTIASADEDPSKVMRAGSRCQGNADCGRRECCVRAAPPYIGRCRPHGRLGARCLRAEDIDEKHQPMCPCRTELECKPRRTVHTEDGDILQGLRCVVKTGGDDGSGSGGAPSFVADFWRGAGGSESESGSGGGGGGGDVTGDLTGDLIGDGTGDRK